MIGNLGSLPFDIAQVAAASAVCNEVRPCFACVLDDFEKETASSRNKESERLFQLFLILLKQYVNSFGAALLTAQGISMTVLPGRRKQQTNQPIEKYTPRDIGGLLRGFALFFIYFKVDAPEEVKNAWWTFTKQLADWLVKRGHLAKDYELSFAPCPDEVKINAVVAAGMINEAAEQRGLSEASAKSVREGEPFYLVSRMAPGRLWFLHSPAPGKCAEFGPVLVPASVPNFIRPGWGFDCKFVHVAGRWYITKIEDVLPI